MIHSSKHLLDLAGGNVDTVADVSVAHRGGRWWMAVGGSGAGPRVIGLYEAVLPVGAPVTDPSWELRPEPLAAPPPPDAWDATGYHCVSYAARDGVERLYYAGSRDPNSLFGPYAIGVLELRDGSWVRREEPVMTATEEWELGTVLEPNVWYADGHWRMLYCAGLSHADSHRIGYAESADGLTGWVKREPTGPTGEFDAVQVGDARVTARQPFTRPPGKSDGIWLGEMQLVRPDDGTDWHNAGVWKPSVAVTEHGLSVFFNASSRTATSFGLSVGRIDVQLTGSDSASVSA